MKKTLVVLLLVCLWQVTVFAGGKQETAQASKGASVGVFVANSFGDKAFYDIALDGIKTIAKQFSVSTNQYEGRLEPNNFEAILSSAGKSNKLVFVLGFEAIDAMLKVAPRYPETMYVFLDSLVDSADVVSLAYKDHEGTFVAGCLAGLLTQRAGVKYVNDKKLIGYIGGVDSPVMQRALWGYEQGLTHVAPDAKVEAIFVGSWVDPAKGKEANLALIEKGSDINFQYAGLSGEGGFSAAKEGAPMWVIGGGYDQRWLAPDNTIASVMKGVNTSMVYLTDLFLKGKLKKGEKFIWGVKEKGVYLTMSKDLVPADIVSRVEDIQKQIGDGTIQVTEFRN